MSDQLKNLGFSWEGSLTFSIPRTDDPCIPLLVFDKNLATITWESMQVLENSPVTLPQTQTILAGQSVSGIEIDELLQVKHYGDGCRELIRLLKAGEFKADIATACAIHYFVAKEHALTWGALRDGPVFIRAVDQYNPPSQDALPDIATSGFTYLQSLLDPAERAVAAFLFMARQQFFFDGNKRTASIMMNGILMEGGYYPITIRNHNSEEFNTILTNFYNSGDATPMFRLFERYARSMYSDCGVAQEEGSASPSM